MWKLSYAMKDGLLQLTCEICGLSGFQIPLPPPGQPGPSGPNDSASEPEPDLAAAVRQQLGLGLVAGKAKLDIVVVDHVEKVPREN